MGTVFPSDFLTVTPFLNAYFTTSKKNNQMRRIGRDVGRTSESAEIGGIEAMAGVPRHFFQAGFKCKTRDRGLTGSAAICLRTKDRV
jgi:hypothetical protein